MDMSDFQEKKMDPTHRMYLCRMLNMKELPVDLLKQYAHLKGMVDRIDAPLSPGVLGLLAMDAGCVPGTDESKPDLPARAAKTAEQAEAAIASGAAKPVEPVDEPVEQAVDEGQVSGATGQAQEQKPAPPDEGKAMLWSPGMPVNVLQEEELRRGSIVGVHPPEAGSGKAVRLTVEFTDKETVTVEENEVEAV